MLKKMSKKNRRFAPNCLKKMSKKITEKMVKFMFFDAKSIILSTFLLKKIAAARRNFGKIAQINCLKKSPLRGGNCLKKLSKTA